MKNLKIITLSSLLLIAFISLYVNSPIKIFKQSKHAAVSDCEINSSPSIQMFFYIKKYAAQFKIPEAYAFSLAYQETRYQGPLDLKYNHMQTSSAGAIGPMQIMPSTAKLVLGKSIPNAHLMNNIKLNVFISMKLIRMLYTQYKNWGLVFGAYNTGRPCINQYARNILNKQYYWIN